ncbi:uncharacterized protein LOC123297258 isoform X2 [Chrysoperla carnea]|uniref:uncharacterized protein LOC123297258 isoform X2 n=1 Tax=Chrysoperla carnea TaxID=189513 RepID=UPI001D076442|nr:uncharacterized protein LOC123297258 isoform X2 [Chrysoperla carnea]
MDVHKRNYVKGIMISAIIIIISPELVTTSSNVSFIPESNLYTLSNISTIFSQNVPKHVTITNEEIKTILHQFNEVDDDLNSIQNIFRSQTKESKSRIVRSVGRSKCTISKQKLTNLKNEIESILSKASSDNNPSTCTLNLNDPDNCNELTKVIQCGIQHLKNGFVDAVTSDNGSIDEIMKWKNAYESLLDKYQKQSDELKQALSEEYQLKLDKLQTDLQKLGNALNKALERLQTTTINLCITEVMLGKFSEALAHFQELKSVSISVIIKECYNFQNGNDEFYNFKNIINFIRQQPLILNDEIAYKTLYKEMESKNHLSSLKIILLAWAIQNSPAKDKLTNVYSKVENYLNKIKDLWADEIYYNRQDKKLTNFATKNPFFFRDILSDTLKVALKKPNALTDKFDNIIQFIKRLPKISQDATAYSILFDEMQKQGMENNNRITKLAYNVRQSMEQPNYQNIEEIFKNMFGDIKRKIPSWARNIIWNGDKCKLKNRNWDQYIYADGAIDYDSERRRVFSWQVGTPQGIMEPESQWKFETDDEGESFMLKNVRWNEYLYAASDYFNYDNNRRQVFTWRPGTQVLQGSWKITPTDNGNYVTIQNINHNKEYLYVDGALTWNKLRRRVFTWRLGTPTGVMFRESEWQLAC